MCFCSRPMKIGTFFGKTVTSQNGLLIFSSGKRHIPKQKSWKSSRISTTNSYNNNGEPWKSSRILRVKPNFLIFHCSSFSHFSFYYLFFLFVGGSKICYLGLNFVTISLHIFLKKIFFGRLGRGGTPLRPLFLFVILFVFFFLDLLLLFFLSFFFLFFLSFLSLFFVFFFLFQFFCFLSFFHFFMFFIFSVGRDEHMRFS